MAKSNRMIFFLVLTALVLFALQLSPGFVAADDHKEHESWDKRSESKEVRFDSRALNRRQLNRDDDGNEVTGQTAAWLLVAGNLGVVISILAKGLGRYFSFKAETISTIKRFNQLQKRYLMRFHYVLNSVALIVAGIHFSLSSCRSSQLPEWGLICLTIMVLLGFTIKLRLTPKRMQRVLYRLHTGSAAISVIFVLLVVGHIIVD